MAYKPPKQTIVDNDLKYAPSNEAVFEALKLKLDEPTVSGTNGQLLQLTGYVGGEATTSWVNPPNPLPSQTGNLDKVLVTDGTNASWQFAGLGAGSLGTGNVILGRGKPSGLTSGTANILLGASAGNSLTTGSNNTIIGNIAGTTALSDTIILAAGTAELMQINNSSTVIGRSRPAGLVANNIIIGNSSGNALTTAGNVIVGNFSFNTTNPVFGQCTVIGSSAGGAIGGHSTTIVGWGAGNGGGGEKNTFIGTSSGGNNTGAYNTAVGEISLQQCLGGSFNTAIGRSAGRSHTTGSFNALLGASAGDLISTGSINTLLGYTAGDAITTGFNNTILGDAPGSATMFKTIVVAAGTDERLRVDSGGNVGIGTTNPTSKLAVSGNAEVSNGDFVVSTVGKGIRLSTESNAKLGTTAAFPATSPNTVTVSTTAVRSNSKIFVTPASNPGGHQPDVWVDSITDSTNFVLKAHDNNFNGTVNWFIIDPLYEPDSEAFFTAASITDATQKLAVDTLVRDLKRYGLWSKMVAIYPFVGGTATAHSYNLKDTTQYQITWNGTVTHDSNGFTGTSASSHFANTNGTAANFGTQDSMHFSLYCRTQFTSSNFDLFNGDGGNRLRLSSPLLQINGTNWSGWSTSTTRGYFMGSRTSSTDQRLIYSGIVRNSPSIASAPAGAGTFRIGIQNVNYSFATFGQGLDNTEALNLYRVVASFHAMLSRDIEGTP